MTDAAKPNPLLVLDVVGLTPRLLAHMPRLRAVAEQGSRAELGTVLPAVTTTVQSTFLTGLMPKDHGIVANGWYFRELGEVFLWRQHNKLVSGEKVWETARKAHPGYRVANLGWWYAMGMTTDYVVTPRPIYFADGKKEADCYTYPPELHDELTTALGTFPLFAYWGANANITSSKWLADAARRLMPRVDLTLLYLPHLDYDLQRFGPDAPQSAAAARELDEAIAPLLEDALARGVTVVALSEYGITNVSKPVDINRVLRREGLLNVYTQAGMEYLDPWTSRAFAVSDHQLAHVYVDDDADLPKVRALCEALPGVAEVLDRAGQSAYGLDHERAGDLVLVADPDAWFTYYYWLDDAKAPDWARNVEIHKKPGYDPAELFLNPDDPLVKVKAGLTLLKKKAGMRYNMQVVPLDPKQVKGSHGRLPADPADGPVLLVSDPSALPADGRVEATEVKELLLRLAGIPTQSA
jgi:predicted AlkP superfamily pyrophosphatase or phosphodiesterase